MRILIINSEYPPIGGGAANASENIAGVLVKMGQEVTVMTSKYRGLPWREQKDGVLIRRVLARRKRADRSLAYEQISFLLGGSLAVIPLMAGWKPHVVLAFFGMPCGGIAYGTQILFRTPYIVSLRGGDVPGFRPYDFAFYHRLISPFLHQVWERADGVVANSRGLRSLAQRFDRHVPIQIIPNGVDGDRFTPVERDWVTPRILFVGRVVYQKGLDLLFHALSNIGDLDWKLTVVGDGPQLPVLERLARRLEITDRVHFAGWKRGDELVAAYQNANLFVYPSRHEGMPNAVLEAMASGLPVIATRISGNEELLLQGETGTLVEPENQQELETALTGLVSNPDLRKKMGEASRERVLGHYSWQAVAESYLRLLKRVAR